MFFILSKVFWVVARPLNFLFLSVVLALVAGRFGARRTARFVLIASAVAFVVIGFTQLPDWIVHRMETAVEEAQIETAPAGIIVLGGGLTANNQSEGAGYHLEEASDRIIRALALKRRFPGTRLIYSGGVGFLLQRGEAETSAASRLVEDLFGDATAIEFESQSKNTWQNAIYTAELLGEDKKRTWLLVTSGFHMPRALGCFRQAGVDVLPAPTDYRADQIRPPFLTGNAAGQFLKMALVTKELIGLIAYRLTGRVDRIWPE